MAENEGPFTKGERLTAVKLNDLAVGRPLTVAGNGVVNRSGGRDAIEIHKSEVIYIRLTEKDTTKTPIRYGWKEVDRLGNPTAAVSATWGNMTDRKAKATDDYAIELNNQNLSVSDNYVYRAERSPATGEWLFFLRKKQGTPIVLSLSIGTKSVGCGTVPLLSYGGKKAWGASAPTRYQIKSSTLRWQDSAGVWTTIKTWDSLTEDEPTSYTFNAPYVPTATNKITIEYSAETTEGTILGAEPVGCNTVETCIGDLRPLAYTVESGYDYSLYGVMTAGCIPGVIDITSPPGYPVAVEALMTATGHAVNDPANTLPKEYTFALTQDGDSPAVTAWIQSSATGGGIPADNGWYGKVIYLVYEKKIFPVNSFHYRTFSVFLYFIREPSADIRVDWPPADLSYRLKLLDGNYSGECDGVQYGKTIYHRPPTTAFDTVSMPSNFHIPPVSSTLTCTPGALC